MSNELAIKTPEISISAEDVKKYVAPNATDKELYMFCGIAQSYGLNPLKREIHFVKYGQQPGQIIVGYETYLKRAEQTGKLDGWSVWIDKDNVGEKAVIEIHRKDRKQPFRWEVYRKEFDKQQSTWKTMPHFMLKKVAISQGFRLAFPEEVGGMPYTPDEINAGASEDLPKGEIVDAEYSQPQQAQAKPKQSGPSQKQLNLLNQQLQVLGCQERQDKLDTVNEILQGYGYQAVESSKEIPKEAMSIVIDEVKAAVNRKAGYGEEKEPVDAMAQMDEDPFAPEAQEATND